MMQRLGAVDNLRNMVNVLREVSFDDIRDEAERVPVVRFIGSTTEDARRLGEQVLGDEADFAVGDFSEPLPELERYDAVVVGDGAGAAAFVERLRSLEMAPPIVRTGEAQSRPETIRRELLKRLPERVPAFGRAFPAMRSAASTFVIDETSVANAQFALVSNIPAIIPIVGGLAAAGTDFIVLTKNQVMMIYKLAAIGGRDLNNQIAIIQEIVPVVGFGFAWRSLAREIASFIPFAAGTLPKVGIAFAGTLVMGRAAEFYYRTNMRPSRSQLEGWARQAQKLLEKLPQIARKRPSTKSGEEQSADVDRR